MLWFMLALCLVFFTCMGVWMYREFRTYLNWSERMSRMDHYHASDNTY